MPTSASEVRHGRRVPVAVRRRASAHTTSAANGSTATVRTATPVNVPTQRCHPLSITRPPPFVRPWNLVPPHVEVEGPVHHRPQRQVPLADVLHSLSPGADLELD